jgi:hypothetical protein
VHVIDTPAGPLTPVGPEQLVEQVPGVRRAAVVGVGPRGTQAVVVVIEQQPRPGGWEGAGGAHRVRRPGLLADPALAAAVRAAAAPLAPDVAAVLRVGALPVDIRHNSKVDRRRVAAWAEQVLAGHPPRRGPRRHALP